MGYQAENAMIDTVRAQWNASAEGWDAQATALGTWLAGPTQTMFELSEIKPGSHVLDLAAGAGEQTVALAAHVGSEGRVLATDLSPALIERLRHNVACAGFAMVEARVADAQAPLVERNAFDAAICRLGLMLMPDPARCIASARAALKPGSRFSAMVFSGPEDNPCIRILMATVQRHVGLPPRDPFAPGGLLSLGRPGHLNHLFETAGLREVSTMRIEAPFRLPSVDDYIDFLRAAAAPVRAILSPLSSAAQEGVWRDVREQFSAFDGVDGWVGPNTLLLTTGRK